mmetsp:Transcript_41947/g.125550  ORF Transcript_41947/g.125550 Transcript_41947/m.125550 type:complete len:212 (+) Transcript_41947:1078-1713(+)
MSSSSRTSVASSDAMQNWTIRAPGPVGLSSLMMLRSEPDSTSERRPSGSRCMRLVRILAAASRRSPTPRKSSSAAAPPPPPPPSFDASRKSVAKSGSIARYGWRQHRSTRSIASAPIRWRCSSNSCDTLMALGAEPAVASRGPAIAASATAFGASLSARRIAATMSATTLSSAMARRHMALVARPHTAAAATDTTARLGDERRASSALTRS